MRACPSAYQWLLDRVKPNRVQNKMAKRAAKWWVFASDAPLLRRAVSELPRFVATHRTGKHRCFSFVERGSIPESNVVAFATDDALVLAILSSALHLAWARRSGATLEDRPHYTNSTVFEPFPFVDLRTENDSPARIRDLGESLDAHRKRQQAAHPELTLTGMYNVLEKLRSSKPLAPKERVIHEQGLVSVLRQIHDELDAAVLAAYGWADLVPLLRVAHGNDTPAEGQTREDAKRGFEDAVLQRLVALNAERAAAEARGEVLWLRPEFQNPAAQRAPEQAELAATATDDAEADEAVVVPVAAVKPLPWPKDAVEQVRAVAELLAASPAPLGVEDIAARFSSRGPWKKRLPQLLEMLAAVGRVERLDTSHWRSTTR